MTDTTIDQALLSRAAAALFEEAYFGPRSPEGTWFVDNEESAGFLGSLAALDAKAACRPLTPGDPATAASHANHLLYALSLANRAARGENPYKDADWAGSWATRSVDETEWKSLLAKLRKECEDFRAFLSSGAFWKDETSLTGALGQIAHGAWHLGAARQGLGLVRSPKE
jgi:hypothetical protein